MLSLNLMPIFKARGIEKPYTFLTKAGFPSTTAHKLLNSKGAVLHFRHLEKLCTILICTPHDILVWRPNKNEVLQDNHPLTALRDQHTDYNWRDTLKKLPLKDLQQIVTVIQSTKSDNATNH